VDEAYGYQHGMRAPNHSVEEGRSLPIRSFKATGKKRAHWLRMAVRMDIKIFLWTGKQTCQSAGDITENIDQSGTHVYGMTLSID
jgi:hypothetical protein